MKKVLILAALGAALLSSPIRMVLPDRAPVAPAVRSGADIAVGTGMAFAPAGDSGVW